jgi:tRNA threonylcarbamoyladenosine biosynthesis protein TsaE
MADDAGPTIAPSPPLSEPELERWGHAVGRVAVDGGALPLVVALRGPLGAGKSVLARAIARGAGVAAPMPSPTYNLRFTYTGAGGTAVHHLDLFRLEHPDDVWELGWEDLGEGEQVVLIEWPERAESLLPGRRWDVVLEFGGGGDPAADRLRRVHLMRHGDAPPLPAPPAAATSGPPAGPSGPPADRSAPAADSAEGGEEARP